MWAFRMKHEQEFTDCAELLKAVADADRLRIVNVLLNGQLNVGEIAEALGFEMVKVSHHLGVLRRSKILVATKQGRHVVYSLHPKVFIAPTGPEDSLQLQFGCCQLGLS